MTADPQGEPLDLPPEYGTPSQVLTWPEVRTRLEAAPHYWLATTCPDGRPHAVPVDGLWLDDACWFGGSLEAVKHRNLRADGRASLHLPDAEAAVMVEGFCDLDRPDKDAAARLVRASKAKYGYAPPPSAYTNGVWRLRPRKVMAWSALPSDATRFHFPLTAGQGRNSVDDVDRGNRRS
ncbi:MAG: pyridoxamine 5'-phosphate oxidase family protein [Acidimicrobiales bacterium]